MALRLESRTPVVHATSIYRLRLFIAGDEPNSLQARESLARLCNEHLAGHCEVEVVDVLQDYEAAITHGVSLVPTLKVRGPRGELTIVGSLRDEAVVLAALGLSPRRGRP